jgi:hypothetical protein
LFESNEAAAALNQAFSDAAEQVRNVLGKPIIFTSVPVQIDLLRQLRSTTTDWLTTLRLRRKNHLLLLLTEASGLNSF